MCQEQVKGSNCHREEKEASKTNGRVQCARPTAAGTQAYSSPGPHKLQTSLSFLPSHKSLTPVPNDQKHINTHGQGFPNLSQRCLGKYSWFHISQLRGTSVKHLDFVHAFTNTYMKDMRAIINRQLFTNCNY